MVPTSSRSTSSPSSTTTTSTSPRSSFSSVIGTLAKGKQRRIKRQVSKANEEQTVSYIVHTRLKKGQKKGKKKDQKKAKNLYKASKKFFCTTTQNSPIWREN